MSDHRAIDAIERISDDLARDIGRQPNEPELAARLALIFGIGIGALAAKTRDPASWIERMTQSARDAAEDVAVQTKHSF